MYVFMDMYVCMDLLAPPHCCRRVLPPSPRLLRGRGWTAASWRPPAAPCSEPAGPLPQVRSGQVRPGWDRSGRVRLGSSPSSWSSAFLSCCASVRSACALLSSRARADWVRVSLSFSGALVFVDLTCRAASSAVSFHLRASKSRSAASLSAAESRSCAGRGSE